MTGNELMIDNIVYCKRVDINGITKIQAVSGANVAIQSKYPIYNYHAVEFEYIIPIKIDGEWLNRLGFKDTTGGWGGSQGADFHYVKDGLEIQTYDSDDNWHLAGKYDVKFKFIHQLQNLFFALTGNQLNCKI